MLRNTDLKTLLFNWDGRMGRTDFWICAVGMMVLGLLTSWMPVIGLVVSVGLLWPTSSIAVKRLHDMGRSGWFAAVPLAAGLFMTLLSGLLMFTEVPVSFSGQYAMATRALAGPLLLLSGPVLLLNLVFLLWIGLSKGSRRANRYGRDPRCFQEV